MKVQTFLLIIVICFFLSMQTSSTMAQEEHNRSVIKSSNSIQTTNFGTWSEVTSPTTKELRSIDMISSNNGWAIGAQGTILHWNGTLWGTSSSPTSQNLYSVAMYDTYNGWAVGNGGTIVHWNGKNWLTTTSPITETLYSIDILSPTNAWAVGDAGKIIHWNGNFWLTAVSPTTQYLYSVDMVSENNGWAVGGLGTIIHWDGNSWNMFTSPTSIPLLAVAIMPGTNGADGWAMGGDMFNGVVLRWQNGLWSVVHIIPPDGHQDAPVSISMISSTDGWAVVRDFEWLFPGYLLQWDGSKWKQVSSPTAHYLSSVSMISSTDGWAVGDGGVILHYVGTQSSCTYFSQRDSRWIDHPLRTNGQCFVSCNTIGKCGCTLTSTAMLFKKYGADLTPPTFSDCMGNNACPFSWGSAANCSGGKASWVGRYGFSWDKLQTELSTNQRPVILGMNKGGNTHWVLVTSGSGNNPANYIIQDPWPLNGVNMRLNAYNNWSFDWISVYSGNSICGNWTAVSEYKPVSTPLFEPIISKKTENQQLITIPDARSLEASSVITGTPWLYWRTDITMTLQLVADSSEGAVTEMLIWTDFMTQTVWRPMAEFINIPVSAEIYARFRDDKGNISGIGTDTLYPIAGPVNTPLEIFLPLTQKP
jgi:photosystem II stability/assembly factor-like uncharacterized protein